jgi:hypothetical protein
MGPPGPKIRVEDLATAFDGEPCDCHELEGDGIDDLSMKFDTEVVVSELQLDDLPGRTDVELVVSGELSDGTRFSATDCVRLVPPGSDPDRGGGGPAAQPEGQPVVADADSSAGDSSQETAHADRSTRPPASEPDDADADEDGDVWDASIAPILGCAPTSPAFLLATIAGMCLVRRRQPQRR